VALQGTAPSLGGVLQEQEHLPSLEGGLEHLLPSLRGQEQEQSLHHLEQVVLRNLQEQEQEHLLPNFQEKVRNLLHHHFCKTPPFLNLIAPLDPCCNRTNWG
jgi:hypothetical protein